MSASKQIVILGAGFAGVETAKELARLLPRNTDFEITLIDRNNFILYTPMLTEVVGGEVEMMHIISSVRQLHPRINFIRGNIEHIDINNKRVTYSIGGSGFADEPHLRTIDADHLVIALGSDPHFFGIPGLKERSMTLKSLCDAVSIHNRALALMERADIEENIAAKRALLTFVIGGGGFSGVETAASLRNLVIETTKYYPNVTAEDVKIIVIESRNRLMPEFEEELADYTAKKLQSRGVELMLNTTIAECGPGYVNLNDNRCIDAHTFIWTGGVCPVPVVKSIDNIQGKYGVKVKNTFDVEGLSGVWAVGDCAEIPQKKSERPYAPTAQNATREGKLLARNIIADICGKPLKEFDYVPLGAAASLGRRSGIARFGKIKVSGFIAWFGWRTIYLMKLPSLRQKIHVGIDWAVDILFGRQVVETLTDCTTDGACRFIDSTSQKEE